ncbi:hypothetical protein Taro_037341, partial [Colocasia esculenta]|nr:hypothetical protein [Colocasia esculenta]
LVIPFLRFGEFISGGPHFPLTSDALRRVVTFQASREILVSVFHALLGWFIASPFILGAVYILLVPCFKVLVQKFSGPPSSPKKQLHPLSDIRLKVTSHRRVEELVPYEGTLGTSSFLGHRDEP